MFVCTLQMGNNIRPLYNVERHEYPKFCTIMFIKRTKMPDGLNLESGKFVLFSLFKWVCEMFVCTLSVFSFHCILLLLHSTYLVCFSSKLKVKFDRESSFDSRIISTQYERGNVWKLCLAVPWLWEDLFLVFFKSDLLNMCEVGCVGTLACQSVGHL